MYHMPTTENDLASGGSIHLALQTMFYKLQFGKNSVGTTELTKSFRWNTHEYSFMQRDAQELNRVLCEKLEDEMKGTVVEGTTQQLFEGHYRNYIECINYVEVERLEGDNKYHDDQQHGLQDAMKGVLFIDFPPVLQLQLNRYEYDFTRDTMVKINDRYEFPLQLDLDREDGKYLSPDADRSVRNLYTLHGVLVHSGRVHAGHYCAFIRSTLSEQWFKFDDEREQYGGETKYSNAYMLVYTRESDRDEIIANVDEKDIEEAEEHKKKEEAEAHLYTVIKVAQNEDLLKQIGRDIYFDFVDRKKVRSFLFGVPVKFQRFWLWAKRLNHTYRPNRPLTLQEETQSVEQLRKVSIKASRNTELDLFFEVEIGPELHPIPPPCYKTKEDILLFFKLYDAEKEEIWYVGKLIVKDSGKPLEILKKINEMAGFSPDEEIKLYEEIKFEPAFMCMHIEKKLTFLASELGDGDIICFQKLASADSMTLYRYPDVPSFLKYVHNLQAVHVHFRSLEKSMEDDLCLKLSKVLTYDDVSERVARYLGLDDPTKIRLTCHDCSLQQPKPQAIIFLIVQQNRLKSTQALIHYNRTSDILYYEVLVIPLPELQNLKTLKVGFCHSTKNKTVLHSIRLPKQSIVGDLLNVLKTKVELSHPDAELRLLNFFCHKIDRIFPLNEKIMHIKYPRGGEELGPRYRLIHVYHFIKDGYRVNNFGEPFILVIHEGETLDAVKLRIQKKLQVPDEEFAKWITEDSDIMSRCFEKRDHYFGARGKYLGLEHSNSSPKRAFAASKTLELG
ncbi:hypothetical protein MKW98_016071 [Papaver atlanticum]|uniref:ubiquitinyl hydrolase 1 n=1 Tax=Papaver atlanticum TaxID=357466 RepID=A0AAD4T6W6_9MAGN|nr:hypothetical protein MKW98_016071 [Papaver atlanticum]